MYMYNIWWRTNQYFDDIATEYSCTHPTFVVLLELQTFSGHSIANEIVHIHSLVFLKRCMGKVRTSRY